MKKIFLFSVLLSTLYSHKLNIFTYIEENTIFINSYFASGAPCKNCEVYIEEKRIGKTDENGDFSLPHEQNILEITIDAGEGHLVREKVERKDLQTAQKHKEEKEAKESFNKPIGVILIFVIFYLLWFLKRKR